MAIKKRNVTSINLTDKNMMFMQKLGYISKRKKSTGKMNISEFINRCIDRVIAIDWPEMDEELELKLLLHKMADLEKKRESFNTLVERDMKEVALAITKVRATMSPQTAEAAEIRGEKELTILSVDAYEYPLDTH